MPLFSELESSLSLDSSGFRRGIDKASGAASSFSSTASGAFERVGDEASESGRSARLAGSGFESLSGALRESSLAAMIAGSRIDEAGDEAQMAGAEAAQGAAGFTALSAGTDGLRLSMGAVSGSIVTVTAAVGGLLTALAPLAATAGLAAGAIGGLAAAFGAIIGSGILAFGQQRAAQNKQQLKQVKKKISKLEDLRSTEKGLTKAQEKQLTSLKEQAKELEKGTTAMGGFSSALKEVGKELKPVIVQFGKQFVPVIQSALDALPGFVKSLLNATGNLKPFVGALQSLGSAAASILPKVLKLFIDVARQALPAFRQIGSFIASNLIPALRGLFAAGRQAAGPVLQLGMALGDLLGSIAPIAGVAGRLVLHLYEIAAAGVSAGASLTTRFIGALRSGIQILGRWSTAIRSAVLPALSALAGAWASMGGRVSSVAGSMASAIQGRLVRTIHSLAAVVRPVLARMSTWWTTHAATVLTTINTFSTQMQEAVIQMMAGVSTAMAGAGEGEASFSYFFVEGLRQMLAAARTIGAQLPAPIQSAMALVAGAVRTNIAQVRTVITQAQALWQKHGGAIRRFATTAVGALQRFSNMVRTAIANPLATFEKLRTKLNSMLPPFLRIQTTAKKLGNVVSSTLLPALAASGLLGVAMKLAPILSGTLLPALVGLRGIALRLAGLFAGPLVGGLRLVLGPLMSIGAMITGTLLPAFLRLGTMLGGPLLSALTSIGSLVGGALLSAFTTLSSLVSGALSLGFTGLLSTLTSASGIMAILSGAVSALLSPIGLLAAAVAGLYIAWKTNLFGIRDIGKKVFGAIKSLITGDMGAAKRQFRQAVSMIGLSWDKNIKPLIKSARQIFNTIKRVVGQAMKWLRTNAVQPALRGLTKIWRRHMGHVEEDTRQLRKFLTGVLNAISKAIGLFAAGAKKTWSMFGDEIKTVTRFAFDAIGSIIGGVLDSIGTAIDIATDLMVGDWDGALNALKRLAHRILGGIADFIGKWGGGLVRSIFKTASSLKRKFVNQVIKLKNIAVSKVIDLKNDVLRFVGQLIDKTVSKAKGWISDFTQPFTDAAEDVKGIFSGLKKTVVGNSTVPDMLDELVGAAKGSWADKFVKPFADAADAIADKLADLKKQATKAVSGGGGGNPLRNIPNQIASGIREAYNGKIKLKKGGRFKSIRSVTSLSALGNAARSYAKRAEPYSGKKTGKYHWFEDAVEAGALEGVFGSWRATKLAKGGTLNSDGLYYGHAGETVVPADVDTPYSGTSTTGSNQPTSLSVRFDAEDVLSMLRGEMVEISEDKVGELQKDIQARANK